MGKKLAGAKNQDHLLSLSTEDLLSQPNTQESSQPCRSAQKLA